VSPFEYIKMGSFGIYVEAVVPANDDSIVDEVPINVLIEGWH